MSSYELQLKNRKLSESLSEMLALFSDDEFIVTQEQKEKWTTVWAENAGKVNCNARKKKLTCCGNCEFWIREYSTCEKKPIIASRSDCCSGWKIFHELQAETQNG